MSLRLQDLPTDVLLRIFAFIEPLDVLRLRQTSKFLNAFNSERTLWTSLYRSSSLFLPSIDLPNHIRPTLERLLVRAQHLDVSWSNQSFKLVRQRRLACSITKEGVRGIELYSGRYLFLASKTRFALFDLDGGGDWDRPMFTMQAQGQGQGQGEEYFSATNHRRCSGNGYGSGEIFIPMLRTSKSTDSLALVIWHLRPSHSPPLTQITSFAIQSGSIPPTLWSADGYLVYHSEPHTTPIPNVFVYDFERRKHHRLDMDSEPRMQTQRRVYHHEYIPTKGFILAMHISASETVFEVFTTRTEGETLRRTHVGLCPKGLTEPAIISIVSTHEEETTLHLAAIFHFGGLLAFRVHLKPDGTITFSFAPSPGNGTVDLSPPSSAYSLAIAGDHRGRARAASLMATSSVSLLLHEIEFGEDSEGKEGKQDTTTRIDVKQTAITVPELAYGNDYAWDAFRGRLCTQPEDASVMVMDYV
ncbi:hypothetical protein V5O48_007656 [Marasmius crinis-equi]|uniref:F-box domain-containing protein n=1 Tax=Marasmius crinis-equi TaxID=585013 RepID=A0ABR3FG12_9AGAR